MGYEVIVGIIIILLLVLVGLFFATKRAGVPRQQSISQSLLRGHEIYDDDEYGIDGKLDGEKAIQPLDNGWVRVYFKYGGLFPKSDFRDHPNWAVRWEHPPQCDMPEGRVRILPWSNTRRMQEVHPYLSEINKLQRVLYNTHEQMAIMHKTLNSQNNTTAAIDQLNNVMETIRSLKVSSPQQDSRELPIVQENTEKDKTIAKGL